MTAAGPGHRRLRAKWWPKAGSALALLLVSAGCSAQTHSPPAACDRSPPARSSPGAPAPGVAPGGQPVSLGTLVAATAGTGPGVVPVRLPAGKPLMTIRFACVGAGPVALSDQHGGPIMRTGGCSPPCDLRDAVPPLAERSPDPADGRAGGPVVAQGLGGLGAPPGGGHVAAG